jgi:hypothetical protein
MVPEDMSARQHHDRRRPAATLIALIVLAAAALPAAAQTLQVETTLSLPTQKRAKESFQGRIEPGEASVAGVARNLKRGDAVVISLVFDYRTSADIALDEVIDRVEITTETPDGEVFLTTVLDTELIPLNPNRVPLRYAATLYHPTDGDRYVLRVRVFGNYE